MNIMEKLKQNFWSTQVSLFILQIRKPRLEDLRISYLRFVTIRLCAPDLLLLIIYKPDSAYHVDRLLICA